MSCKAEAEVEQAPSGSSISPGADGITSIISIFQGNGEFDVKCRTEVRCTLEKNDPPVPADDPVGNGQTQPGAGWVGRKEEKIALSTGF